MTEFGFPHPRVIGRAASAVKPARVVVTPGPEGGEARHVLLVDDDEAMREVLVPQFGAAGFRVTEAGSVQAASALALAPNARFDAMLLDVGLPDGDGRDLCARLRQRGLRLPVLMLTGCIAEADVVRGLDAGANDYVIKPFRLGELIARVRAQIRAHEATDEAVLRIGPYQFRPSSRVLADAESGRRVRLTEKEAAVLKFLYRAAGRPVARRVLLHEVWGYSAGADTHTVETHIYRLRRKLEPDPANARLLVNERGGYRLYTDSRPPETWRWISSSEMSRDPGAALAAD